jgi:hypothetical protein
MSSCVSYWAVENELLDIMEELAPTQMEAETISSLCAVIVGALATPRFSLLVNWRYSDIDRLLGMSSVEEGAMWHVDPLPSNGCC